MPKMSDLNPGELAEYIASYERKVKREPGNMEYQRKLAKLKEMQANSDASLPNIENISIDEHSLVNPDQASPGGVEKFHDDEEDHSFAPNATFGQRAIALFIDGILLSVVNNIIGSGLEIFLKSGPSSSSTLLAGFGFATLISIIINIGYQVYFLRNGGQTIGKKLMKIKVVYFEDPSQKLSIFTIIIREAIGKLLSWIILFIGYITFLFGNRTWHDKLAKTNVVIVS